MFGFEILELLDTLTRGERVTRWHQRNVPHTRSDHLIASCGRAAHDCFSILGSDRGGIDNIVEDQRRRWDVLSILLPCFGDSHRNETFVDRVEIEKDLDSPGTSSGVLVHQHSIFDQRSRPMRIEETPLTKEAVFTDS